MKTVKLSQLIALFAICSISFASQKFKVDVDTRQYGPELSPELYGLFFEDINFAADGGLYAELVQNRSFEYYPVQGGNPLSNRYHPLFSWEKVENGNGRCSLRVEKMIPLNRNNPNYLAINIQEAGDGVGVKNSGFQGIFVDKGEKYNFSVYARREGRQGGPVVVSLIDSDGNDCGSITIDRIGNDWRKYEAVITAEKTMDNASLSVTTKGNGTLYLDMVSLFPQKTYNERKNGLRKDLVQALKDLNPKFFRFPGGCIVHGHGLENAYRWKDSVGDVAERKGNWNRWGYHQTYGLGYYEYMLLCEDIGATALPVMPVGVSCGFNSPYQCVPMDELQPWIDDAVDLIEFANGPVTSKWGKLRKEMGHPEPFNLKYICLGNEEHDRKEFHERMPLFVEAVRKAHPEIKIIGNSGLSPNIPMYPFMKELQVHSSDEHYYESPDWFIKNHRRFDSFDRSGPKIFVGEYASHSGQGNALFNAVSEAAYLTGVERNGDIVEMTCYAPLFAKYERTQWPAADLIWFTNREVVKTPSYYVQQMFGCNKGDVYLPTEISQVALSKPDTITGAVGIGSWNTSVAVDSVSVQGKKVDLSNNKSFSGSFSMEDGDLVQTDQNAQPSMCVFPAKYDSVRVVYNIRAKKLSGSEGFLIVFGFENQDDYLWWNIGGWNNTQHAIEKSVNGQKTTLASRNGSIQTGKWYDLKVELTAGRIKCFIDDQLIHDYELSSPEICAASSYDKANKEVIVKLVNPTDQDTVIEVNLDGVSKTDMPAEVIAISGARNEVNTLENPEKVVPVVSEMKVDSKFDCPLPACSVKFIKVNTK